MPISIYPPILQSSQPAFLYNVSSYSIYFDLQKITSPDDIGHYQVRVVKQTTNRSIVNTSIYPDGTIYKTPSQITEGKKRAITILGSDLAEAWKPGELYKIQMRLGVNPKFEDVSQFATWKQKQIEQNAFSEWSTVMIIKAISKPDIYIKNAEVAKQDVVSTERTEPTLTPLFSGFCSLAEENYELVYKYRFTLYKGNGVDATKIIETSEWLLHNSLVDSVDEFRFKNVLTEGENYTVTYEIVTVNGYEDIAEPYKFLVFQNFLAALQGVELYAEDNVPYCSDNGCINLYLTTKDTTLSGSFVVTRASEFSDYNVWEDITYLTFNKKSSNNTLIFQDFTIESGVKYKYAIQQENAAGLRTTPTYDRDNRPKCVNFEYSFLYHNGVQLRLQFNQKVSSFKHTTLTSKQDTLGDKYPHLTRNGYAYYAEFPISGLISLHMDDDNTFFSLNDSGYWYDGELAIPQDKYAEGYDYDLTHNNFYIERRFREKVEEFLNNFDYKLYKSPSEGNIVVVLHNVSLTPNAALGRMIFDFSATAYEVLENTLENLDEFGVIDIGHFESLSSDEISYSFGQISGLFQAEQELFDLIKEREEVNIGGGYRLALKKISSIWVENYPKIELNDELLELQAEKARLQNEGQSTDEIDKQIEELTQLIESLSERPPSVVTLIINGKEIAVGVNRIYSLEDIQEQITSITLKYTQPVVINYKCQLVQVEDEEQGVISSIDSSRIWGQISGMFTGTDKILQAYNSQYKDSETYRIYDPQGEDTNINLYKTTNLLDIIEEETRKQVEEIYELPNGFTHFDEETDMWTDGTLYYFLAGITLFDIEAEPGTVLYISKDKDGANKSQVTIGSTGRYTLNPSTGLLRFVALQNPQFAIINYKCLTNQMKLGGG